MKQLIGYKSIDVIDFLFQESSIKKEILLFDKIWIDKTDYLTQLNFAVMFLKFYERNQSLHEELSMKLRGIISDIEFLEKKGIIEMFNTDVYILENQIGKFNQYLDTRFQNTLEVHENTHGTFEKNMALNSSPKVFADSFLDMTKLLIRKQNSESRLFCSVMNDDESNYLQPILREFDNNVLKDFSKKTQVIKIVLNNLPIPIDSISLEQLIDFKSDPDTRTKYLSLRNWVNDISQSKMNSIEIQQKVEYLINQYENHLRYHKLKYKTSQFETIVTTTAEVLENLVSLKWSKIAKSLFQLGKEDLELIEKERNAPGKEVAYLSKIKEKIKNET